MKRSNRARRFDAFKETTEARAALERRWAERLVVEPRLAPMVTAQGSAREAFHRWLPYRQGFSPGLVRLFIREMDRGVEQGLMLDPFSGSATTITECASNRRAATGVEALEPLVFLANARFAQSWTPLPTLEDSEEVESIASKLELPIHRAALMLAQSRRHTGDGTLNRAAAPINRVLIQVGEMMKEDLGRPLPIQNSVELGDARELANIEDESIAAIITSPPYLSRYDYTRTNDPVEKAYRIWYPRSESSPDCGQVEAAKRRRSKRPVDHEALHDAIDEAQRELIQNRCNVEAGTLAAYFSDMNRVLESAHRVLCADAQAWFVIGGVRIKDIHIPADLIFAELAEANAFAVEGIRVARDLNPIRRKFGSAGYLAPRESIIMLRKM